MVKLKSLSLVMLFMALALSITSCSKDNDEEPISIPQYMTIHIGDEYNLGLFSQWTTTNDFIASVSNNGIVTGLHVGECIISDGENKCEFSIRGNILLYDEPLTDWGISKSRLISICGSNYIESKGNIGYKTNNISCPMVAYMFKNDQLSAAIVLVSTAKTSTLAEFLLERYLLVEQSGYEYYFLNGNSMSKVTMAVGLTFYNVDYWMVAYIPVNQSRAEVDNDYNMRAIVNDLMSIPKCK